MDPWLLFSNELYVRKYEFDSQTLSSVSRGHTLTHVVDYDWDEQKIYFADIAQYKIQRMDFDGTNREIVNEHNTLSVEGRTVVFIESLCTIVVGMLIVW